MKGRITMLKSIINVLITFNLNFELMSSGVPLLMNYEGSKDRKSIVKTDYYRRFRNFFWANSRPHSYFWRNDMFGVWSFCGGVVSTANLNLLFDRVNKVLTSSVNTFPIPKGFQVANVNAEFSQKCRLCVLLIKLGRKPAASERAVKFDRTISVALSIERTNFVVQSRPPTQLKLWVYIRHNKQLLVKTADFNFKDQQCRAWAYHMFVATRNLRAVYHQRCNCILQTNILHDGGRNTLPPSRTLICKFNFFPPVRGWDFLRRRGTISRKIIETPSGSVVTLEEQETPRIVFHK